MRLTEAFAATLRARDVRVMFGVMGDANMYFANAFHRTDGARFVASANEGGAVQMAAGYAAVSGDVGVATVTHGAITNTVSALFDATRGRYPVLLIAGDTMRADGYHLQNIPQREVVLPTGAAYREIRSPQTAVVDLSAALQQARAERRPVVLDLPAAFQDADGLDADLREREFYAGSLEPSREAIEAAAALIISSNRPLVLAGRGAAFSGASGALRALATRIGAPVSTTLRGQGLFHGDPADLGICGTLANPVATEAIVASDCLIVFGAGLNTLTTLKGEFLSGKRVVQIDTDPASLGRYFPVDVGVLGDAGNVARAILSLVEEADAPPTSFRSRGLVEQLESWHRADREPAAEDDPLDLPGVMHRLNRLAPTPRTLAVDGGRFCHLALRILDVDDPLHYVHCLSIGHIGMSVGYGIGAACARPDLPCLVVVGDGGFMLGGLAEFNTAVRVGARLVVCLINDGAYGAEYYRFVDRSLDPALTTFSWPGFAEIASALGGFGVRVDSWAALDHAIESAFTADRPALIEILLDRDAIPDPEGRLS